MYTGKILQLAAARLAIEALDVPPFGLGERRVHEDLDELVSGQEGARAPALRPEGRDERYEDDEARIHHEPGDLGHAPDVLHPVLFREPQVLVQAVADIVSVEQVSQMPGRVQPALDEVGDCALAGAGQAGKPYDARSLARNPGARGLVDIQELPLHVL